MTTIKLNDPTVDLIVKDNGLEYIKIKFSPNRKHKLYNDIDKKIRKSTTTNKKAGDDFLALTTDIKSNLSKSYTAEEANTMARASLVTATYS